MLEPTPIRLKYEAHLHPSHSHVGARPPDAEAHPPHVQRKVELHVNAQVTESGSEAASDSSAARGGLGLEEEMEMLDTGLQVPLPLTPNPYPYPYSYPYSYPYPYPYPYP